MDIQVVDRGAFSWALVGIRPGEQFVSESGAMFRSSSNIDVDVTTRSKRSGGLLSGLRRMLADESFFFSTYSCTDREDGEVGLAPKHQGQIATIDCDGVAGWVCTGGSYLGSTAGLNIDTDFQGLRGMFSGESLSFLNVSGAGTLLVNAFGRIEEVDVSGELTVDTGHVVAFQDSLHYSLGKAGGSWLQSFLAGEGVVLNFSGQGKLYVQSHNPDEFGKTLGPLLPERGGNR
jgi:uncharacterized protein (TIGR00266 family)